MPDLAPGYYVRFDGLPSHLGPRFVELEDQDGRGHGKGSGADWRPAAVWHPSPTSMHQLLGPFYRMPTADERRQLVAMVAEIVEEMESRYPESVIAVRVVDAVLKTVREFTE